MVFRRIRSRSSASLRILQAIVAPRLNILGFGVREEFFAACHDDDVANGFLSRMAVFEEKEMIFPRTDFEPAEFIGR